MTKTNNMTQAVGGIVILYCCCCSITSAIQSLMPKSKLPPVVSAPTPPPPAPVPAPVPAPSPAPVHHALK